MSIAAANNATPKNIAIPAITEQIIITVFPCLQIRIETGRQGCTLLRIFHLFHKSLWFLQNIRKRILFHQPYTPTSDNNVLLKIRFLL